VQDYVNASASSAFISYSREDSEFALRLAQDLKAAGAPVWLDQIDIEPGAPWDNAIEDALEAAQYMVLVLSPASARSANVRDEVSYALEQGKIVIPVLYVDCVVPLRLQRKQRIDFRADYARGLEALLDHLRVMHPNPQVLEKAAEADAHRQAAWQAREAEARRLAELKEQREAEDQRRSQEAEDTARHAAKTEAEAACRREAEQQRQDAEAQRQKEAEKQAAQEQDKARGHAEKQRKQWKNKRLLPIGATVVVAALLLGMLWHIYAGRGEPSGTWTDPATGLMWANRDNGYDVAWQQSLDYCKNLHLEGHSDWRLPEINGLTGIFDTTLSVKGWGKASNSTFHVKGNLRLSGLEWSDAAGIPPGAAWFFSFDVGAPGFSDPGYSYGGRALCVRGSVKSNQAQANASADTWTDPATGLMWTKRDNGKDVNWQQAANYCKNLHLEGYSDWRLPEIIELSAIYDPTRTIMGSGFCSFCDFHVKGDLLLSDIAHWSNTQGNASGGAWGFFFNDGSSSPLRLDFSQDTRALCVRGS
jgi:hypothetical protein